MGRAERFDTKEKLLQTAHDVIGERIDERADDPGWSAELKDDRLLTAAREYVEAHEGVEVMPG